jgi:hypothetical protein
MKKFLLLIVVFMLSSALFAGQIVPKVSLNNEVSGNVGTSSFDADLGISLGAEYLQDFKDNIKIGAGLEYQLDRAITKVNGATVTNASFGYMPIYATGEYLISMNNENMIPFAKLNLGYATYNVTGSTWGNPSTTGGMYWAIGGGVTVNKNIK